MSNQRDLFGEQLVQIIPRELRPDGKPRRKPTRPQGYAAQPGTGPEGETCGPCEYHVEVSCSRTYHKCAKFRALGGRWTGGPGSDILVRSPACKYFERREGAIRGILG